MKKLAEEIIQGKRLTKKDDLSLFEHADLRELEEGGNRIREALCGNQADLCTIINGKSGRCSENCIFCAQSSYHHTDCSSYELLNEEIILDDCKTKEGVGIQGYSIVTAGRSVKGRELDHLVCIYKRLHQECKVRLCASHGLLEASDFKRLKQAGVRRYHANIETSERNFPNVCTTHTYEDKIRVIRSAQEAGLEVCSGGIIGMGETWQDRVDMALALAELNILSIPLNLLMPIKGTPLENCARLTEDEIVRTAAMFRYINPTAYIRMAAGRGYFRNRGCRLFRAGVNAAITGDMLTTVGSSVTQDVKMLRDLGFDLDIKNEAAKEVQSSE